MSFPSWGQHFLDTIIFWKMLLIIILLRWSCIFSSINSFLSAGSILHASYENCRNIQILDGLLTIQNFKKIIIEIVKLTHFQNYARQYRELVLALPDYNLKHFFQKLYHWIHAQKGYKRTPIFELNWLFVFSDLRFDL